MLIKLDLVGMQFFQCSLLVNQISIMHFLISKAAAESQNLRIAKSSNHQSFGKLLGWSSVGQVGFCAGHGHSKNFVTLVTKEV